MEFTFNAFNVGMSFLQFFPRLAYLGLIDPWESRSILRAGGQIFFKQVSRKLKKDAGNVLTWVFNRELFMYDLILGCLFICSQRPSEEVRELEVRYLSAVSIWTKKQTRLETKRRTKLSSVMHYGRTQLRECLVESTR